jgi:hypothetical protein
MEITAAPTASALPPPAPVPTPPAISVAIRLTHAAADHWLAEYTFSAPVASVVFQRSRIAREQWRVEAPAAAAIAGTVLSAPEPFTRLVVDIPTSTAQPEKEYRPFYRYGAHGALVYTGQLAVGPSETSAFPGAVTVTALAGSGEHVVVPGEPARAEGSVTLDGEGSYVYVGDLEPIATPSFVGVFDPSAPPAIYDRVVADIPRVFALYADRLGPLPPPTPTLFFTFAVLDGHGSSIGGGTLPPHTFNLDVEIDRAMAARGDASLLRRIDFLVAHEAAHFYNSREHAHAGGPGSDWMHEGSADALAARALRALGAMDERAYLDWTSEALSECALWLSTGEPLVQQSVRPGHSRASYACGASIALLTEAAVHRHDARQDLFTFWRAVFDEGPRYTVNHYACVLDRLAGGNATTRAVFGLVGHSLSSDPSGTLRDALRREGIETGVRPAPFPDEYERHASVAAFEALVDRTCLAGLAFSGDSGVRPVVQYDSACQGLAKGDVVVELAGAPLRDKGATAYVRAAASCQRSGTVEAATEGGKRATLRCEPWAKAPPVFFEVVAAP